MSICFLIGGTGNQLYQIANMPDNTRFSSFFLSAKVCGLLGWTHHERLLKPIRCSHWKTVLGLLVLTFDLLIFILFKRTFLCRLDLRKFSSTPKLFDFVKIGYFQAMPSESGFARVRSYLIPVLPECDAHDVLMHVRGGDILALENESIAAQPKNSFGVMQYGVLEAEFYGDALKLSNANERIIVSTNDRDWAQNIIAEQGDLDFEFIKEDRLPYFIACALKARIFIASNSTLSWWIVWLRSREHVTLVPVPFFVEGALPVPTGVLEVPATWRK